MLKVTQLSYQHQRDTLLSDITFDLLPGELLVVLGPNGAGKSTLLKCCAGTLKPSQGSIHLNNTTLEQWPLNELAQSRAVLTQQLSIPFALRVHEVVSLGLSPWSLNSKEQDKAITHVLNMVGMAHFSDRVFNSLSGGEQQRVQLARVLVQLLAHGEQDLTGKLLFLDEPISALDLQQQQIVMRLLKTMTERGMGIFCVLHDLNLATLYADTLLIIERGETVYYDTPSKMHHTSVVENTYKADLIQIDHSEKPLPQWQFRH